jgi:trehalose synthase
VLPVVPVRSKRIQDYVESAGEEAVSHLRAVAEPLRGARLLHGSSTPFGGGVAELLHSHVPLLNDLGIETVWMVLEGTDEFYGDPQTAGRKRVRECFLSTRELDDLLRLLSELS